MAQSLADIVFDIGLMFIFTMLATVALIAFLSIVTTPILGGAMGALFFIAMSVIIVWKAFTKLQGYK